MGLNRLKRGYLIQFKRYVDQLTGSSGKKDPAPCCCKPRQDHDPGKKTCFPQSAGHSVGVPFYLPHSATATITDEALITA